MNCCLREFVYSSYSSVFVNESKAIRKVHTFYKYFMTEALLFSSTMTKIFVEEYSTRQRSRWALERKLPVSFSRRRLSDLQSRSDHHLLVHCVPNRKTAMAKSKSFSSVASYIWKKVPKKVQKSPGKRKRVPKKSKNIQKSLKSPPQKSQKVQRKVTTKNQKSPKKCPNKSQKMSPKSPKKFLKAEKKSQKRPQSLEKGLQTAPPKITRKFKKVPKKS